MTIIIAPPTIAQNLAKGTTHPLRTKAVIRNATPSASGEYWRFRNPQTGELWQVPASAVVETKER